MPRAFSEILMEVAVAANRPAPGPASLSIHSTACDAVENGIPLVPPLLPDIPNLFIHTAVAEAVAHIITRNILFLQCFVFTIFLFKKSTNLVL